MPRAFALAAVTLALATAAAAPPSPEEMQRPAFERAETAAPAGAPAIAVSSALVKAGGAIPLEFTRYGRNLAPPVAWSGAPHATKSYAILVEDPDARPKLVTHWVIWNIPGDVGVLPRGVKNTPEPDRPKGARQGPNSHGGMGWAGPHPPLGDPPHHYHLQVFALDRTFGVGAGADKEKVLAALRGHVLAKGEVVGEFAAPAPPAPKPAAPPAQ